MFNKYVPKGLRPDNFDFKLMPLYAIIIAVFSTQPAQSQTFTTIKEKAPKTATNARLPIGTEMPDVAFLDLVNYSAPTAKLSDFKSKLVILDFWNSLCHGCVESFPAIQSLQNKFAGKMKILMVNYNTKLCGDDDAKVKAILKRYQDAGIKINLPVVLNCKKLDKSFPTISLSEEIWIKDNKVMAITDGSVLTANYIQKVLNGEHVNFRDRIYVDIDRKHGQTLFGAINGSGTNYPSPLFSSILYRGEINGLGTDAGRLPADSGKSTGIYINNAPLIAIFQNIYSDQLDLPQNQILLETRDSLLFSSANWGDTARYSKDCTYELNTMPLTDGEIRTIAQNDLSAQLGVIIKKDRRLLICYILSATQATSKSYAKGGKSLFADRQANNLLVFRNVSVKDIVEVFNRQFDHPLIDETGLDKNIDMDILCEGQGLSSLTATQLLKALENAGFEIKLEKRMMDVDIIADK